MGNNNYVSITLTAALGVCLHPEFVPTFSLRKMSSFGHERAFPLLSIAI